MIFLEYQKQKVHLITCCRPNLILKSISHTLGDLYDCILELSKKKNGSEHYGHTPYFLGVKC